MARALRALARPLVAALACSGLAAPALAAPTGYSSTTCIPSGSSSPVCAQLGTSTSWRCDPNQDGTSSGADYTVVYASDQLCDGDDYCAFGTNSNGDDFYCHWTDTSMEVFIALGNPKPAVSDTISFQYDEGTDQYDLDTHTSGDHVDGVMFLMAGDDTAHGSRVHSGDYMDRLHGDAGDDTLYGYAGNDTITGDSGDDTIDGGLQGDVIRGGAGNDTINGDNGYDIILGGEGDDSIAGDGDNDTIYGGGDDDHICGDGGTDTLYGNGGDDTLYCGSTCTSGELNHSGTTDEPGGDTCDDHGATNIDCETETSLNRITDTTCP